MTRVPPTKGDGRPPALRVPTWNGVDLLCLGGDGFNAVILQRGKDEVIVRFGRRGVSVTANGVVVA